MAADVNRSPDGNSERLAYSVATLAPEVGMSRQTIRREIQAGRLRVKRIRGRIVIPAAEVRRWLTIDGEE